MDSPFIGMYKRKHDETCIGKCGKCQGILSIDYHIFWPGEGLRNREYLCFERGKENFMKQFMSKLPIERRLYHEVIDSDVSRRFYVDIDDKDLAEAYPKLVKQKDGKRYEKVFNEMVSEVQHAFRMTVWQLFVDKKTGSNFLPEPEDFLLFKSNSWEESSGRYKCGAHLVLKNVYLGVNEEINEGLIFEQMLSEKCEHKFFKMDSHIGKSSANMRLLGHHKRDSTRIKTGDCSFLESLITNVNGEELVIDMKHDYVVAMFKKMNKNKEVVEFTGDIKLIDKLCSKIPYSFIDYDDWFKVCFDLHDLTQGSDEGLNLFDKWSKLHNEDKYDEESCKKQWTLCGENKSETNFDPLKNLLNRLFEADSAEWKILRDELQQKPRQLAENKVKKMDFKQFEFDNIDGVKITKIEERRIPENILDQKTPYSTVALRSPMDTGKTFELVRMIKEKLKKSPGLRVIIISHRCALSNTFYTKFTVKSHGLLTMYDSHEGALTENCLIVQIDSLYRVPIEFRKFDIVIIDEYLGNVSHYCTPCSFIDGNTRQAYDMIMKQSKHVIVMDALLDMDGIRTLKYCRQIKDTPIQLIHNTYQSKKEKCIIHSNLTDMLRIMIKKIIDGKRVVIPTTSKAQACDIKEFIQLELDWGEDELIKKMVIYTSETDGYEKKQTFLDVNKAWKDVDIVIFTPTCSEGISYDDVGFDYVFSVLTDRSTTAEVGRQLLHRVRNVSSNEYHVHIMHSLGDDVDEKEVRNALKFENWIVRRHLQNTMLELDDDNAFVGDLKNIKRTPFFKTLVLSRKREMISETNYFERFVLLAKQSGATVEFRESKTSKKTEAIKNILKAVRKTRKDDKLTRVVNAEDVDDDKLIVIREKRIRTPEENWILQKADIKQIYRGDITKDVVAKFGADSRIRALLKAYKIASVKNNVFEEIKFYIENIACSKLDKFSSVFGKVQISVIILNTLGYCKTSMKIGKKIKEEKLMPRFKKLVDIIDGKKIRDAIRVHFQKRRIINRQQLLTKDVAKWVGFVNPLLISTFDIKLLKENKHSDKYVLVKSKLFGELETEVSYPKTYKEDFANNMKTAKTLFMESLTEDEKEEYYKQLHKDNAKKELVLNEFKELLAGSL